MGKKKRGKIQGSGKISRANNENEE